MVYDEPIAVTWAVVFPEAEQIASRRGLFFKFVVCWCGRNGRPEAVTSDVIKVTTNVAIVERLLEDPDAKIAESVYRRLCSEYIFKAARELIAQQVRAAAKEGSAVLLDGPLFRELGDIGNRTMIGMVYRPDQLVTTLIPWQATETWFSDLGFLLTVPGTFPYWYELEGDGTSTDRICFFVGEGTSFPFRLDLRGEGVRANLSEFKRAFEEMYVADFRRFETRRVGRAVLFPKYFADAKNYRREVCRREQSMTPTESWATTVDADSTGL